MRHFHRFKNFIGKKDKSPQGFWPSAIIEAGQLRNVTAIPTKADAGQSSIELSFKVNKDVYDVELLNVKNDIWSMSMTLNNDKVVTIPEMYIINRVDAMAGLLGSLLPIPTNENVQ